MKKQLGFVLPVVSALLTGGLLWATFPAQAAPTALVVGQSGSQQAYAIINSPIRPLPTETELDQQKVALGRTLFHDPRLSRDNSIACASCHDVDNGGADAASHSAGIGGAVTGVNSPTVLNSGFNFAQFWDGRAASLEEQIDGPIHHPGEMGSNWQEVLSKLRQVPEYVEAFNGTYDDGIRVQNVKDAIATYERSLVTPSRFDQYLTGSRTAISEQERAGYDLFAALGCISCHQGRNVGGNMFQKFGVVGNYFRDRGNVTQADYGRYNVTGNEDDIHVFKVPSLRNIELTAPYFHDGSADTLEAAVQVMAEYQLGRILEGTEVELIVAFLRTLTGETEGQPQ